MRALGLTLYTKIKHKGEKGRLMYPGQSALLEKKLHDEQIDKQTTTVLVVLYILVFILSDQ
jgi:hypothetical protein